MLLSRSRRCFKEPEAVLPPSFRLSHPPAAVAAVSKSLRRGGTTFIVPTANRRSRRCFKEPEAVRELDIIKRNEIAAVAAVSKSLRRRGSLSC